MQIYSKNTARLTPYIAVNGDDYIYKCYPIHFIYEIKMFIKLYINDKKDIYATISFRDSFSELRNMSLKHYLSRGRAMSVADAKTDPKDRESYRFGCRFAIGQDFIYIGNLKDISKNKIKYVIPTRNIVKTLNHYIDKIYCDPEIFHGLKRLIMKIKQFFNFSKIYFSNEPANETYDTVSSTNLGKLHLIGINTVALISTSYGDEKHFEECPTELELFCHSVNYYIDNNLIRFDTEEKLYRAELQKDIITIFDENDAKENNNKHLVLKNHIINHYYTKLFLNKFCKFELDKNLMKIIKSYIK